jgi:hypothetical protein
VKERDHLSNIERRGRGRGTPILPPVFVEPRTRDRATSQVPPRAPRGAHTFKD